MSTRGASTLGLRVQNDLAQDGGSSQSLAYRTRHPISEAHREECWNIISEEVAEPLRLLFQGNHELGIVTYVLSDTS